MLGSPQDEPSNQPGRPRRMIVAITGASGALYAQRTIEVLLGAKVEVHLVISPLGQRLLHDELGTETLNGAVFAGSQAGQAQERLIQHNFRDVGASIASGSFQHDGMIVVPCSANTLACVAHGQSQNLIHRAAQVALKERRRLVLVHREMPLSLTEIRNMEAATQAGAIIAPANPGFYLAPENIGDLVDFVVCRCLDLLGVDHDLQMRWGQ